MKRKHDEEEEYYISRRWHNIDCRVWSYLESIEEFDWFEENILSVLEPYHWQWGSSLTLARNEILSLTPYYHYMGNDYEGPHFYFMDGCMIHEEPNLPRKLKDELLNVYPYKNAM